MSDPTGLTRDQILEAVERLPPDCRKLPENERAVIVQLLAHFPGAEFEIEIPE